jgi:hypothetical protein
VNPSLADRRHRVLRDLRISVTDRCNFRCRYCMPREHFGPGHHFLDRPHLLTFDEIERLARLFVALGVRKLRLTGGEPLLRDGIEDLVRSLAAIPDVDLAMTTNGAHLATKAADLATAGTVHTCLFSSAGTGLRTSLWAGTLHWIRSSQIAPTESSTRFVVIGPAHLIPPQSISINNADTEQTAGLPADRAESLVQNAIGYALGSSGCLSDSVVDSTSNACRRTPDSGRCAASRDRSIRLFGRATACHTVITNGMSTGDSTSIMIATGPTNATFSLRDRSRVGAGRLHRCPVRLEPLSP